MSANDIGGYQSVTLNPGAGGDIVPDDSIREWQKRVHALSKEKGWHDCQVCEGSGWSGSPEFGFQCGECAGTGKVSRNILEMLILVHSEISEAVEFFRTGNEGHELYEVFAAGFRNRKGEWVPKVDRKTGMPKPDGFAIELADAVIRIMDLAEYLHIDLAGAIAAKNAFNQLRPYRHGNLKA